MGIKDTVTNILNRLRPKTSQEDIDSITKEVTKQVLNHGEQFNILWPGFDKPAAMFPEDVPDVKEDHLARMTTWFFAPLLGQPRNVNINRIRDFSNSFWVKICVNAILDEIAAVPHKIVPAEPDVYKELEDKDPIKVAIDLKIKQIEKFFKNPNRNSESWSYIRRAWHKDNIELDSGVIVKVFSKGSFEDGISGEPKSVIQSKIVTKQKAYTQDLKTGKIEEDKDAGDKTEKEYIVKRRILKEGQERDDALRKGEFKLNEIYARDGGSFLKHADRFGITHGYFQYSFLQPFSAPEFFNKKEIIYATRYPRSNSVYGWSIVQSLFEIVQSLNKSIIYNRDFFEKNAIPPAMISAQTGNQEQFERFKREWKKQVQGKGWPLPISNFPIDIKQLIKTNREMEFLNSQKWYANLVCSSFGTTPGELGINIATTGSSSRATQEGQERVHLRKAIKPLLALEEYHVNTEIIPEFFGTDEEITVKYECVALDLAEELREQKLDESDLDRGVKTINEVRIERGLEPVDWGDVPVKVAQQQFQREQLQALQDRGVFAGDNRRDQRGERVAEGTPDVDETKATKISEIVKTMQVDREEKTDEIREEASSYGDFIIKEFSKMEKQVLQAVEKNLEEFVTKSGKFRKKTFGEFISDVFNAVLRLNFRDLVKKFIKKDYLKGIENGEAQLNVDVGFGDDEADRVEWLTDQQMEGYRMSDGKRFVGIKGATKELQQKIINSIHEGITKKEALPELKKRVQSVFDVNDNRATVIARSETNRIMNMGQVDAFVKSGLEGEKEWFAAMDDRTSDICRTLNGQKVGAKENFRFEDREFSHPPAHPQCRSTLLFHPKKLT